MEQHNSDSHQLTFSDSNVLTASQKENILHLWNREYPEKLRHAESADFDNYLHGLQDKRHLLLTDQSGTVLGWAFSFLRLGERWFAIIIDASLHKKGYGSMLLDRLKARYAVLNGWVIDHNKDKKQNGEFYRSPLKFYLNNNFTVQEDVRLENEILSSAKITWHYSASAK